LERPARSRRAIVADLAVSDEVGRMLLPDMGETRGCEFSVER
jgi:hypothetical protein